jgi:hypothetical protein
MHGSLPIASTNELGWALPTSNFLLALAGEDQNNAQQQQTLNYQSANNLQKNCSQTPHSKRG